MPDTDHSLLTHVQARPVDDTSIFLGNLRLQPASAVSRDTIRAICQEVLCDTFTDVIVLPASSSATALTVLHEHAIGESLEDLLNKRFHPVLCQGFGSVRVKNEFDELFMHAFGPSAHNTVQHFFAECHGWTEADRDSEETFRCTDRAFLTAYYYHYGFMIHGAGLVDAGQAHALARLMLDTAIPFALTDGGRTILCLAR